MRSQLSGWLLALMGATGCASRSSMPVVPAVSSAAHTLAPRVAAALAEADSLITAAVGTLTPGAVLAVSQDGTLLHERAFGFAQLTDAGPAGARRMSNPPAMTPATLFDLASVTKVMATTLAVMRLVDDGRLDVDAPVSRYLPDFTGVHRDSITIRHLLSHSAGLVQWQPLYYHASTSAQTYATIRDMPLQWGVGEGRHYSDLGFMLLGDIVERVSGVPLDVFMEREFYGPMGLRHTAFNPRVRGFTFFAATEHGNAYEHHMVFDSTFGYRYRGDPAAWNGWRHYVLDGEVNDGNAYHANGGVAGHAGLFSTARDVSTLMDLLVEGGMHDGRRYLSQHVIQRFFTLDQYGNYLGWMRPAETPAGSFSHTGFTGTYVLGVPALRLSVVLLTNRQNMGTDARGYFPNLATLQSAVTKVLMRGMLP